MKLIFIVLISVLLLLVGCPTPDFPCAFPVIDIPADYTDCKEAVVYMYNHFDAQGYEVYPVVGNLELIDEELLECNHTWIMVMLYGEYWVAYDWGQPYFDEQHYHGYKMPIEAIRAGMGID